MQVTKKLGLG